MKHFRVRKRCKHRCIQLLSVAFLKMTGIPSALILENSDKWAKVFKNGPSKICGKQPLKDWKKSLGRPY